MGIGIAGFVAAVGLRVVALRRQYAAGYGGLAGFVLLAVALGVGIVGRRQAVFIRQIGRYKVGGFESPLIFRWIRYYWFKSRVLLIYLFGRL